MASEADFSYFTGSFFGNSGLLGSKRKLRALQLVFDLHYKLIICYNYKESLVGGQRKLRLWRNSHKCYRS